MQRNRIEESIFNIMEAKVPKLEQSSTPTINTQTNPPYTLFFSFDGVYNFSRGLLEGANLAKTGKMVTCIDNANGLIAAGNKTFEAIAANLTFYGFLNGFDEGFKVLYLAGGLSSDCVTGFFEL